MRGATSGPAGRRRARRASAGSRALCGAWRALILAPVLGVAGCAVDQVVALSIEPAPVEVFVDGELAASGDPRQLSLRADRGHVVLIRRAGYRPQQVVIESVRGEGGPRLEPDRIAVRLAPERSHGQRVRIGLDEPAGSADRDADATSDAQDGRASEPDGDR